MYNKEATHHNNPLQGNKMNILPIGFYENYYKSGRERRVINKSDIEGVCQCGYLTLKPTNDFEKHNGGLVVKRSKVVIVNDNGSTVRRLTGITKYSSCNACVNNWK
jgi:hypothetical protein